MLEKFGDTVGYAAKAMVLSPLDCGSSNRKLRHVYSGYIT
jgi:hypothetical protein